MDCALEDDTMARQLGADVVQALFSLRDRIAAAEHGRTGALVQDFARTMGRSPATVYAWLREHTGYRSGRKRRADAGTTVLPDETLRFVAAARREGLRGNGKATMPTAVAMHVAHANGMCVNVSEGRMNALLRARCMDTRSQAMQRSHVALRSLHPNHVHQIDPSLCLIYYTPRGQAIMRDEEFYKNKPASMEKVRLKVWRYVCYDHASGVIWVRYFEATGENQYALLEFLLYVWQQQPGRVAYGVPRMVLWDKGSANTSFGVCSLLDAMGVQHVTHATGHAWVKGGVEQANNLVETHFESRLRLEPVQTVQQLNEAAERWVRDFNANAIEKVDCRVRRASGVPMVRDALWQTIMQHAGALVQAPSRAVCQWFMAGQELVRQVRNLRISFAHPQLGRSCSYDLSPWAQYVSNGQKVRVVPLLMQHGALRVEIDRVGDAPLLVQVLPQAAFDAYGRAADAPVLGQDWAVAAKGAAARAADELASTAWGDGVTQQQAEAMRARQARPFGHHNGGRGLVAHSHLGQAKRPAPLLPRAAQVDSAQVQQVRERLAQVQQAISVPEAVRRIQARLGDAAAADLYAQVKARFADGHVPVEWADAWQGDAPEATGTYGPNVVPLRRGVA